MPKGKSLLFGVALTDAVLHSPTRRHGRYDDGGQSHMRYKSFSHTLLLVVSLFSIAACSPNGSAESGNFRQGAKGLVEFRLPGGWTPVTGSSETRFQPAPGIGQGVQIQVTEIPISRPRDLEKERDVWLDHQKESGSEVLKSELWRHDGFAGVEYVHTGSSAMGSAIWHVVNIQNEDVLVATYLVASGDAYETCLPVFLEVVKSIRPVESGEAP